MQSNSFFFFSVCIIFSCFSVPKHRGKQKVSTFSDFNGQQRKKAKIKQILEFNIDYVNFFKSLSNLDLFSELLAFNFLHIFIDF